MRKCWILTLGAIAALAACEPADPLAESRRVCADAGAEAEARMNACSTLIDSGALEGGDRADALANRGAATFEAGDVTAALRDYDAALQADDANMLATLGRAGILIDSGQLDAAAPLVEKLIANGAFPANAHFLNGRIAALGGDQGAALESFERSIAADARFFDAYAARAQIRFDQQDYVNALTDFDRALDINPQLTPALAGRCWTRVMMEGGDVAAARRDADAAASADPRSVRAQLCRGLLQLRAEEWEGARVSYDAVLEIEPGNPTALFGRGVARRRAGDNLGRDDMNRARDFSSHIGREFEELGVRSY